MSCQQSFIDPEQILLPRWELGTRSAMYVYAYRSSFLDESTTQMKADDEAKSLQSQMQKIRDKRAERVGDLQMEAQRLVDWKEYVRSAPVASLVGSVAAGFLVVSAFKQTASQPLPPMNQLAPPTNHLPSQASVVSRSNFQWAVSMLLPIVTSAAKKHLMKSLSTVMQGSSNEHKSTSQTIPERRAYSE